MTEENLEITKNVVNGVCKISLRGRVDSNTSDAFLEKLEAAIEEGNKNILLNMFHVVYLSSIGIRIILKTYKKLSEEGGSFKIEHPSEIVKNVLGMVALKEMMVTN